MSDFMIRNLAELGDREAAQAAEIFVIFWSVGSWKNRCTWRRDSVISRRLLRLSKHEGVGSPAN